MDTDMNNHPYKKIPVERTLKGGHLEIYALISPQHFSAIDEYAWFLSPSGYAWTMVNDKPITMHRMVYCLSHAVRQGSVIDHKNNDRLCNLDHNLREGSIAENNRNRSVSKNNKLGLKGVYARDGQFRATIRHNHTFYHLGDYDHQLTAALAYNIAATALWGDWAWLNPLPVEFPVAKARLAIELRVWSLAVAGGLE